ncbi:MAG: hypothetical protein GY737_32370 [Desulfobacteraceae bacterium]|nr:hypothetical protein [Desulfobacteraceae bacterium]
MISNTDHAEEMFRGQSKKPLYVTSAGISQVQAASNIGKMAGRFRVPDLLKRVDKKARMGMKTANKEMLSKS